MPDPKKPDPPVDPQEDAPGQQPRPTPQDGGHGEPPPKPPPPGG